MKIDWIALFRTTLFDPKAAAGRLIELRQGLGQETLWMAVVLAAVMNALIISVGMQIFPPPPEQAAILPPFFHNPALLAMFAAGAIVIMIFVLYWAGLMLGGEAELQDVQVLITWLELVQVAVQVLVLILALVLPPLAGMLNFVAFVWGIWIFVAFIDRAHRFGNPLKAVVVMVLSLMLMAGGLMVFALMVRLLAGAMA